MTLSVFDIKIGENLTLKDKMEGNISFLSRHILLLILITITLLSGCSREGDEEVLRRIVEDVAEASERKDIKGVTRYVSESYRDFEGNDFNGIKGILLYHFLRAETITIFVRKVDVRREGDSVVVDAKVILVRGREVKTIKDILPEEAAAYEFNVIFKKEGGKWKAVNARWENVGITGLLG